MSHALPGRLPAGRHLFFDNQEDAVTRKSSFAALLLTFAVAAVFPARGQQVLSPRDSVFLSLDTNVVSVNYGRPSMRGRAIMGHLVPWHRVWRTGANEATHLKTNFDMMLGDAPVLKGRYTLWTIPGEDRWTIIVNKQTGQWGTRYDERQDLARFDVKPEHLSSVVDTFRISLEATGAGKGVMKLMWEKTVVQVPFEKNTHLRPLSPGDSAMASLGTADVKIRYSTPFTRGRKIWGVVVPFDSVWRTGANAATQLITSADVSLGGTTVPQGSYTLYSIPKEDGLTLIISKKPGGFAQYDPSLDLARVAMRPVKPGSAIDPFRIWFQKKDSRGATLHLGWGDQGYAVDILPR